MSRCYFSLTTVIILLFSTILFCGCKDNADSGIGINPPGKATNPSPHDTATDVFPTTTLTWVPAENAYLYHIYLGTDQTTVENADTGSPEYQGETSALIYDPPGDLQFTTTYYWRIDCGNTTGTTKGDIWSFTTILPLPAPIADFTASTTSGQAPLAVSFTDTSTGLITSWSWDFNGDGTPDSTIRNPSCTYNQAGIYTVSLTVTGPGGTDAETKTDYINVTEPPPTANFTGTPTSGNAPLTVQFTDLSTGTVTTWAWDFDNDGSVDSSVQNPTCTYVSDGTYSVKLTVTGPSGSDFKTRLDYITVSPSPPPPPFAAFSGTPTSGIAPLVVSFTDESTGSITSWEWDFDNNSTIDSTAQNPTHEYSSPGTYSVKLTVTGPGGSDAEVRTGYIIVNTPPVAPVADFIGSPTSGTSPLLVSFTDLSTGTINTWLWDFGDGNTSTEQDPTHTYTSTGTFTISLTVDGPGGSNGEVKLNYIAVYWPAPVAEFSANPTVGIAPLLVTFTDLSTGNITSWEWDFNNDSIVDSNQQNATYIYSIPGTYTAKLTVIGPGGTDSEIKTDYIVVNWPAPVAEFSANPTLGDVPLLVSFTDLSTGNITSWEWDFDNDSVVDSNQQNATYIYSNPGTYTVKLTVTGPGGTNSEIKADFITVNGPPPYAAFTADPVQGGAPLIVSFTDLSTGFIDTWSWDLDNDGSIDSSVQNPTHVYANPGVYSVTLIVTNANGSCRAVKGGYITVSALHANFTADITSAIAPATVNFTDLSTGNITSWEWDFDNDGSPDSSNQNPQFVYGTAGCYTVKLTVTGPGGSDSLTRNYYITIGSDIIYVHGTNGDDLNGGTSWIDAVKTIQKGIDLALGSYMVLVADGSYMGTGNKNLDYTGKDIIVKSAGGADSCIIDCEGSGRGFHFCTGETNSAVLHGLTVQNGGGDWNAGGIYCEFSNPTIVHCVIQDNSTENRGGGIWLENSNAVISNCTIKGNLASTGTNNMYGGGICCTNSNVTIANCNISNNSALTQGMDYACGGGVCFYNSNGTMSNCVILDNTGSSKGGGICCWPTSSPTINQCVVQGNYGAGVYCEDNSNPSFTNCIIRGNSATIGAGICAEENSSPVFTNCNIVGNWGRFSGGIASWASATPTFMNCVIWSNRANEGPDQINIYSDSSTVNIDYCVVDSSPGCISDSNGHISWGPNNVYDNPLFVSPGADYHLLSGSPCVGAGNDTVLVGDYDLDGNTRRTGIIDIGAYEWSSDLPTCPGTIQAMINAATNNDTISLADGFYSGCGNYNLDFGGKTLTIISDNGFSHCIIDCEQKGRGFYFHNGEDLLSELRGLTIKNGLADYGGAICCEDSSAPTVINCMFESNKATTYGGAFCCNYSSAPEIGQCIIRLNTSKQGGGGIYLLNSDLTMTSSLILENTAELGGGISCYIGSTLVISKCSIQSNTAKNWGGGIAGVNSSITADWTSVNDNYAGGYAGGGIYCGSCDLTLTNSNVTRNSGGKYGGGIGCGGTNTILSNCVISNNRTWMEGGGVWCETGDVALTNCTITNNSVDGWGGGLHCFSVSNAIIKNCILWGNTAGLDGHQIDSAGTTVTLSYCTYNDSPGHVSGTVTPDNCIFIDPAFTDAGSPGPTGGGNFRLLFNSPCIDTGYNQYTTDAGITVDLDGYLRIVDGNTPLDGTATVDMGSYEYQPP